MSTKRKKLRRRRVQIGHRDRINDFKSGDYVGYIFIACMIAFVIIIFVECI